MKEFRIELPEEVAGFMATQAAEGKMEPASYIAQLLGREQVRLTELRDYLALSQAQIDQGQTLEWSKDEAIRRMDSQAN
jgi:hypothetical protein